MRTGLRTWLVGWAIAITFAGGARAQSTAFDGTYVGVSATFNGSMSGSGRSCPNFAAPAPMSIAGGHAQLRWSESTLQGDVTAQGTMTLRAPTTGKLDGQIDPQGKLTATYAGACTYSLVWQRRR